MVINDQGKLDLLAKYGSPYRYISVSDNVELISVLYFGCCEEREVNIFSDVHQRCAKSIDLRGGGIFQKKFQGVYELSMTQCKKSVN